MKAFDSVKPLIETVQAIADAPWKTLSTLHLGLTTLGFGVLVYLLRTDEDGFLFIDHANLVFHEAGHPLFGLFGSTLGLYGGTLGQLVFPIVALGSFWAQRETVGFAVAGAWFFENFFNIARYMADARAQVLPLVGGGEHDWTNILSRWNALSSDTLIAGRVAGAGWVGLLAIWIWIVWRWKNGRGKGLCLGKVQGGRVE
jgi:hypothetical protein